MLRSICLVACWLALSACTVIRINKGDTETIEYEGDAAVAQDLTTRACRKAGQQSAEILSTVNKDPTLPPGKGRQITTFRCSSAARPPQAS